MSRTNKFGLSIDDRLYAFLTEDVLPGTGLNSEAFFEGFSAIVHELSPKNRELLAKRDALQEKSTAGTERTVPPRISMYTRHS